MTGHRPVEEVRAARQARLAEAEAELAEAKAACRTIAEVEAQADADSAGDPPLSQDTADKVAAILLAARPASRAA